MSQESAMQEEIEDLRTDLEAAKLREAELASAVEIARTAIETALRNTATYHNLCACYLCRALRYTNDPSAALAERDRAIVQQCADMAYNRGLSSFGDELIRKFNT